MLRNNNFILLSIRVSTSFILLSLQGDLSAIWMMQQNNWNGDWGQFHWAIKVLFICWNKQIWARPNCHYTLCQTWEKPQPCKHVCGHLYLKMWTILKKQCVNLSHFVEKVVLCVDKKILCGKACNQIIFCW